MRNVVTSYADPEGKTGLLNVVVIIGVTLLAIVGILRFDGRR